MPDTAAIIANIQQACPGAFFAEHRSEIMAAAARVLDSGRYILGGEVEAFELEFSQHFNLGRAVGVGSGTDAIAIALRALGVGPGDRVATVSHTAVGTVAAIEMTGAAPVFVDIDPASYTMDPESLTRTLQVRAPVKAIIVVHLYGNFADLSALLPIATRFGVPVVEDCAQAHGARLGESFAGSLGAVGTFSFYPTKNLGAMGDGGMIVARDPDLAYKMRALREYGWQRRYISEEPGVNSRLDELQAAILRVRLPYLDAANARRAAIAAAYDSALGDTGLILPSRRPGVTHVYHQYVVRHPRRDRLRFGLSEKRIGANIHYPVPVHRQPAYAGRIEMDPDGLVATDAVAPEILSLPMYPELSDAAVEEIVRAIRNLV